MTLSGYSKTRISELLRGNGLYPGWGITCSVVKAMDQDIPLTPLLRLWAAAAAEACKDRAWISSRISDAPPPDSEVRPVAHRGLTEAMEDPYFRYARAFLQSDRRSRQAVAETFDILWLTWHEATGSAGTPRYAWQVLRSRVMARVPRREDGRPDLRAAAFSTVAQEKIPGFADRIAHIDVYARFFDLIAGLPEQNLDVAVLRYLCGIEPKVLPGILGLSPALTRTLDHHARGALDRLSSSLDPQEGTPRHE
ncbi:XRE family transcriptional regulator [Streptomyces griseoviridis]|uniref:XRE family transcriptional regulator n=1 Tax=Streptomyces griseoviridis TaxID=45398 RepID=UPI003404400A